MLIKKKFIMRKHERNIAQHLLELNKDSKATIKLEGLRILVLAPDWNDGIVLPVHLLRSNHRGMTLVPSGYCKIECYHYEFEGRTYDIFLCENQDTKLRAEFLD